MTLKFDGWPRKIIGHFFYVTSSFVHHFKAISKFKLELLCGNAQLRSKLAIFLSCVTSKLDGWPRKKNRVSFLCYFKPCAWLLVKMSTNRNVDNQNVDKPKRRQTKTSTNRNVDKPKRRQTETSTNRNVDKPKRRQTKTSTNRNVDTLKLQHNS